MNIALHEQVLAEILRVPIEGTRSLENESRLENFLKVYGKFYDLNIKNVSKKSLK